jgi:hypothetical protein
VAVVFGLPDEWGDSVFALALPGMNVVIVGLMCHCAQDGWLGIVDTVVVRRGMMVVMSVVVVVVVVLPWWDPRPGPFPLEPSWGLS